VEERGKPSWRKTAGGSRQMEIVSSVSNESADWKMAAAAVQELKIKPEPKDSFDGLQLPTEITIYINIMRHLFYFTL